MIYHAPNSIIPWLLLLATWRCLASAHFWIGASSGQHSLPRYSKGFLEHLRHDVPELESIFRMPQQWNTKTYGEQNGSIPYHRLNKTLYPLKLQPLPLGTIKAQGWFQQQLDLMAEGMPGRMHEFYRLVKDATWGGGKEEYSILNEAWPYYINGLVPLAFAVDNSQVLDAVNRQISYVLLKQFLDGWLGPEADVSTRNFWGRYPFFLAAAQYVEAAGAAESQQMLEAMHQFVNIMHSMLKDDHQGYVWREGDHFDEQWGRSRAADMVLALQWLYENYPDNNQERIHECMFLIYTKAYDWSWWFKDDVFLKNDIESYPDELIDPLFPFLHVVNTAQGLKSPAVMGRLLHDQALFDSSRRGVQLTFDHHGVSSGAIIGDERMSGNSATRGSELCSVVEAMFSLSTLYQILGDASFADRLEKAAFNAMPAMIMPDWWAHQYVAQINQPYSYEIPDTHFWNVGPWGVTFGVEPNYPCCAVNFPQGYPKLLSSSWVRTPEDNGIAHVVLIPSEIKTVLKQAHSSNHIHIRCSTNYPFTQLLEYHVEAQEAFSFSFRVPEWVDLNNPKTGIYLDKSTDLHHTHHPTAQKPLSSRPPPEPPTPLKPDPHTGLHTISLPAGPLHFTVYLSPSSNTKPTIHQRPNNAIALTHGALLFALNIPSDSIPRRPANYQREGEAPPEANDWTIVPRTEDQNSSQNSSALIPWNIAIDPSTARVHEHENLSSNLSSSTNSTSPFTSSPLTITVTACEISWPLTAPIQYEDHNGEKRAVRGGYPVEPPRPDPKTGKHECIGEAFEVELRPFGGAKIRMAEFPVVDLGGR